MQCVLLQAGQGTYATVVAEATYGAMKDVERPEVHHLDQANFPEYTSSPCQLGGKQGEDDSSLRPQKSTTSRNNSDVIAILHVIRLPSAMIPTAVVWWVYCDVGVANLRFRTSCIRRLQ